METEFAFVRLSGFGCWPAVALPGGALAKLCEIVSSDSSRKIPNPDPATGMRASSPSSRTRSWPGIPGR